jgi:hypothetical protein
MVGVVAIESDYNSRVNRVISYLSHIFYFLWNDDVKLNLYFSQLKTLFFYNLKPFKIAGFITS